MERQYVGIRAVGNPPEIFDRIRQVVQHMGITRMIPAVKFERRARREFYVFLAVEGTVGPQLPDDVLTVFQRANLRGKPLWPIDPAGVKLMAGSSELETHSLNAIPYTSLWSNDAGDLFDLSETSFKEEESGYNALSERYDRLIYWLSTNAEGTWQTFAKACTILQLAEDVKDARSIFRRLILLGYIENSDNGQKWSICPTALVQCATDQAVYFFTGQQTPKLIGHLREHYDVEILPQSSYQGPSCVKVNGIFTGDVTLNGFNIVHAGTVSVQLAELLPDLEGWKDILPAIDRLGTTTYSIEIWNGKRYIQCDNFYERNGRYCGDSGLYRLTKQAENNPYQIVLYFDEPNQRWLCGDWYGLRFLAYDSAGRDFGARYDSSANEILIPVEEHWPLLYERTLVLASGMLPLRDKNFRWLKYTNISNELVQLLAEKLNITITEI